MTAEVRDEHTDRAIEVAVDYERRAEVSDRDAFVDLVAQAIADAEARGGRFLQQARTERDEARQEYDLLRDAVIEQLNPADDDIGEPAIMVGAIEFAARTLAVVQCSCPPDAGPPEWESFPCGRCQALGRARDVRVDR